MIYSDAFFRKLEGNNRNCGEWSGEVQVVSRMEEAYVGGVLVDCETRVEETVSLVMEEGKAVRTLSGESKGSTDTGGDDDDQHGIQFDGDV